MSSDFNFTYHSGDQDRAELNRILTALQRLRIKSQRDALHEFIALSPHQRTRTMTGTISTADVPDTDNYAREMTNIIRRKPVPSISYPLIHTTTGTISWQYTGHKLAGNGIFNGSSYITITDDDILDVTATLTLATWIKPQSSTGDHLIIQKNNAYELKLAASNTIQFRVFSGGAWKTALSYTYTPNTWVYIVATYKSTASGQKLYINGSLNQSDSETGAISTNTNDLKIGGDGTSNLPNNSALSWLFIGNFEASTAWITDFYSNKILDSDGTNIEITTIPFIGNENPEPDATTGLCNSG